MNDIILYLVTNMIPLYHEIYAHDIINYSLLSNCFSKDMNNFRLIIIDALLMVLYMFKTNKMRCMTRKLSNLITTPYTRRNTCHNDTFKQVIYIQQSQTVAEICTRLRRHHHTHSDKLITVPLFWLVILRGKLVYIHL